MIKEQDEEEEDEESGTISFLPTHKLYLTLICLSVLRWCAKTRLKSSKQATLNKAESGSYQWYVVQFVSIRLRADRNCCSRELISNIVKLHILILPMPSATNLPCTSSSASALRSKEKELDTTALTSSQSTKEIFHLILMSLNDCRHRSSFDKEATRTPNRKTIRPRSETVANRRVHRCHAPQTEPIQLQYINGQAVTPSNKASSTNRQLIHHLPERSLENSCQKIMRLVTSNLYLSLMSVSPLWSFLLE
nr:hypothetical protein [Tanacetum cinerariifolium]